MRTSIRGAPVVLLLAVSYAGLASGAAAAEGYAGSEACATCHEEKVKEFARTPHATMPGWDAEKGCESCHGPGQTHIDNADGTGIVMPNKLVPKEASDVCLSCHKDQRRQFSFPQSTHSLSDVSCVDCHNPHLTTDKMLPKGRVELCATCHAAIAGQFDLPRSHPLDDRGDGCVACHNPHGTENARMFRDFGNETCTQCHIDKQGPFLYEHDISLVDGCQACHQVHGSSNRHLLTHSRQINLCYQCHPGTQTPTFHSAPGFLNEKCASCHTAIHGSNTNEFFLEE